MAYDEGLAERVRDVLVDDPVVAGREVTERKMFGGLAFLVDGNMAVAVSGQGGLMVRVDPAEGKELVATTAAYPMVMQGRALDGWLRVDAEQLGSDADIAVWAARGTSYSSTLPAK